MTNITNKPIMKHMTAKRKAVILYAVTEGHMSESEACREYGLSHEEFTEWLKRFNNGGIRALKVNPARAWYA